MREGKIGKDFGRNPGQIRSIWGKWLDSKLSGKNYENITNEIVKAGYKMPDREEIDPLLMKAAERNPEPVEYSKENFEKLFGDLPGKVDTVLGEYKFGDIFFTKLEKKGRENALAYIENTMKSPPLVYL